MKIISKIWEWLTFFFAGVTAGVLIFIKFFQQPTNLVNIEKIKNKNSNDNNIDIPVEQQIQEHKERVRKKLRIFNKKNL